MRATIPEEIKQARWIVKERQEMLAEAKRNAIGSSRTRVSRPRARPRRPRSSSSPSSRPTDIVDEAKREARETRLEMEDWADSILSTLE